MYFLTGSQQFHLMEAATESLSGRIGIVQLYPFSEREMRRDSFTDFFHAKLLEVLWSLKLKAFIIKKKIQNVYDEVAFLRVPRLYVVLRYDYFFERI